jgi:5-methylcytosine-specific restriction endonuclease McrA
MSREEEIELAWEQHLFQGIHRLRMLADTREQLAEQQGWLCAYCGIKMTKHQPGQKDPTFATLDHKIPRCKKGTDDIENLVASCAKCNNMKSDMDLEDFLVLLRRT